MVPAVTTKLAPDLNPAPAYAVHTPTKKNVYEM